QVEQQIRFETLRAFYGLLLAEAKKEVAAEAVKLAEADVKLSRDRVEAGTSVVSDLLAAEVQLAEARQQAIQSDGDAVTAEATLNTALGLPISTPRKVSGALAEKKFDVPAQEELIRLAMEHRPDLNRAGLVVRSGEVLAAGARNEYLPRVDVFASFGASRNNFVSGSSDYTVGASVSFNLFDAGRSARIAQTRAAAKMAAGEQEHLANQIRLEVVRAQQQFISARERLKVAERIIAQAGEALRITQDRYQEGLTTITEVLRAETTLTRARLNILAARHDYYVGYAGVLLSTGQLKDVQVFVS
ncbi:MAG TPA: TolC family protein, partial [Blastocatellia bacterium]|nr:TolC family protein [Blastocatellia bacterium]